MKCVKVGCLSEFKSRKYPVASNARNHNSKAGRRGEWLQVVQPDVSFNSGCLCHKCEQTFLEWLTLQTPDDEEAFTALAEAVNMKSFKAIAEVVSTMPKVMELLQKKRDTQIQAEIKDIVSLKAPSLLRDDLNPDNITDITKTVVDEVHERAPLLTSCIERILNGYTPLNRKALIYSILLNSRNKHMAFYKKSFTMMMVEKGATSQLIESLVPYGLTCCNPTKVATMEKLGVKHTCEEIKQHIKAGGKLAVISDNINIGVTHRTEGLDRTGSTSHNWIYWWIRSVPVAPPEISTNNHPGAIVIPESYLLNEQEEKEMLSNYSTIVAQIISRCMPNLKITTRWAPQQIITHENKAIMDTESQVWPMPVIMKNQMKVPECCDYLVESTRTITELFNESDIEVPRIPTYGDQLTRRNLDLAVILRHGEQAEKERLSVQVPVLIAPWHMKQDLLDKLYKLLYGASGRKYGTLSNMALNLKKSRVTGAVKGKFRSHHEFLLLVLESAICSAAMAKLNMTKLEDDVEIDDIVKFSSELIREVMYTSLNDETSDSDALKCQQKDIEQRIQDDHGYAAADPSDTTVDDEWHSYYRCLLNYGLQYLQMDSVAKEGDVGRFIIMLKRNLELFLGYHHRSLYAAEIVDTLTKLRSMDNMSAARAISGMYIKTNGNIKEVDLETEIQVKTCKAMVKGLGANKENKVAVRRITGCSRALRVISGGMANKRRVKGKGKRTKERERGLLVEYINRVDPWKHKVRRCPVSVSTFKQHSKVAILQRVVELINFQVDFTAST